MTKTCKCGVAHTVRGNELDHARVTFHRLCGGCGWFFWTTRSEMNLAPKSQRKIIVRGLGRSIHYHP